MRVLFLSDLETLGGAGISASRLAAGLAAKGVEVIRFFNSPGRAPHLEPITWRSQYVGPDRPTQILLSGARRLSPRAARAAARAISGALLRAAVAELQFDLLHIHSIHACDWDHQVLGTLDANLPTVWTFNDCWSFSAESQRYRNLQGDEVRLKPDGDDREAALRVRKRYFDSRKRLRTLACSQFTASEADKLLGDRLRTEAILPGVPLDRFAPVPRAAARASLGLEEKSRVLMFIADNLADPLKGFEVLRRALVALDREEITLMIVGDATAPLASIGKSKLRTFGRVTSASLLSILYSAADVLVMPSLAEALGLVSMESIACGTPVVGSAVGGIPEAVRPGETGFLFPHGDSNALASTLAHLFDDRSARDQIAARCRAFAEEHWSLEGCAEQHLAVYRSLLG